MQEKVQGLVDFVWNIPPIVWGVIMAFIISILRVLYDKEQTTKCRIILEAVMCGGLTLAADSLVQWFGAPPAVSVAVGGAIGFIGVVELRQFALKFLDNFGKKK